MRHWSENKTKFTRRVRQKVNGVIAGRTGRRAQTSQATRHVRIAKLAFFGHGVQGEVRVDAVDALKVALAVQAVVRAGKTRFG